MILREKEPPPLHDPILIILDIFMLILSSLVDLLLFLNTIEIQRFWNLKRHHSYIIYGEIFGNLQNDPDQDLNWVVDWMFLTVHC